MLMALEDYVVKDVLQRIKLDVALLEKKAAKINKGIFLGEIDSMLRDKIFENISFLRSVVPFFFGSYADPRENAVFAMARSYNICKPCSMLLSSEKELKEHMVKAYIVSNFHYVLGKAYNLKGSFPDRCCGMSGRSVMLSLMAHGYPNAAYAYSGNDHGYVILPFVIEQSNAVSAPGVVFVDPTSDQFSKNERNLVFANFGYNLNYSLNNISFAPSLVASIDILIKTKGNIRDKANFHRDASDYLVRAYSNPVRPSSPGPFV